MGAWGNSSASSKRLFVLSSACSSSVQSVPSSQQIHTALPSECLLRHRRSAGPNNPSLGSWVQLQGGVGGGQQGPSGTRFGVNEK